MFIHALSSLVQSSQVSSLLEGEKPWSVLICLLGRFRLLNAHHVLLACGGERAATLLGYLALCHKMTTSREQLQELLWPNGDPILASQSLNTLIYTVRKVLKDELGGAVPVLQNNGHYRLNCEVGISIDIVQFERLIQAGEQYALAGEQALAAGSFRLAVDLYQGDLCMTPDPQVVIQRERLRACYLTLLMRLADHHYLACDYTLCQKYVQQLLYYDPCREDAHRLAMRCYVQVGERAQAFRQYRLCQELLRAEFDATPEPTTAALFDQIRVDPATV